MSSHHENHPQEKKPVSFTVPLIMAAVLLFIFVMFLSLCDPKPHHECEEDCKKECKKECKHDEHSEAEEAETKEENSSEAKASADTLTKAMPAEKKEEAHH